MINRMVRAARLDVNLYEEVEHDERLTGEAFRVVALASAMVGLGTALGFLFAANPSGAIASLIVGVLRQLITWAVWSYVTYFIGTRLFGGTASYGELLRTLGYAYTPIILGTLFFIPILGGLLILVGFVWWVVAGVVAVQQALDFDTSKAIATVVIALIPAFVVIGLIQKLLSPLASFGT